MTSSVGTVKRKKKMHINSIDVQLTETDLNENISTTDKKKIKSKMGTHG